MRDRPVCILVDSMAADLHELALGPRSSGHRCSVPTTELCTGLCLPSICSHQEMPEQGPLGRSTRAGVGHTNLANSNVVFNAGMDVHRKTHPDSNNKTVVEKPQGREPPFNQPRVTESSHMASIQRSLVAEGISEEVAKLFLSSWRRNTEGAYSSCWRRWERWCIDQGCDFIHSSLSTILQFLTSEFKQRKQYRTINSYRSAISMTHGPIDGVVVGKHPFVCRLLKGIYNQRSPQPRYSCTWDVGLVLDHIRSCGLFP